MANAMVTTPVAASNQTLHLVKYLGPPPLKKKNKNKNRRATFPSLKTSHGPDNILPGVWGVYPSQVRLSEGSGRRWPKGKSPWNVNSNFSIFP